MHEILTQNKILAIVFIVAVAVVAIILAVKAIRVIGMEKIRGYVYKKFVEAEHKFQHGENTEKFEYVICLARNAVPSPFHLFITESFLRTTIQLWFDLCKDLLDDGKLNGTNKKES